MTVTPTLPLRQRADHPEEVVFDGVEQRPVPPSIMVRSREEGSPLNVGLCHPDSRIPLVIALSGGPSSVREEIGRPSALIPKCVRPCGHEAELGAPSMKYNLKALGARRPRD